MFSWLSSSSGPDKTRLPEPTALQALRAKQIERLRSLDCPVSELHRDVEYRVTVNDQLSIFVFLPPQFPQEKPILSVTQPVLHPWINDQVFY